MKKVNEVCKIAGVSKRTLQYYDDENVLSVERSDQNYRLYSDESLEKIWQILIFREMNFSLKDIREYLSLSDDEQIRYLSQRIEVKQKEIHHLYEEVNLISLVLQQGIPPIPENQNMTYKDHILNWKKNVLERI